MVPLFHTCPKTVPVVLFAMSCLTGCVLPPSRSLSLQRAGDAAGQDGSPAIDGTSGRSDASPVPGDARASLDARRIADTDPPSADVLVPPPDARPPAADGATPQRDALPPAADALTATDAQALQPDAQMLQPDAHVVQPGARCDGGSASPCNGCPPGTIVPAGWVCVPATSPEGFTMGSPPAEPGRDGDETQHAVTLTRSFLLKSTEVTQGEWLSVMDRSPSSFSHCGDDCPVEQVSWYEAVAYCNALSTIEGLPRCYAGAGGADYDRADASAEATPVWRGGPACAGYRTPIIPRARPRTPPVLRPVMAGSVAGALGAAALGAPVRPSGPGSTPAAGALTSASALPGRIRARSRRTDAKLDRRRPPTLRPCAHRPESQSSRAVPHARTGGHDLADVLFSNVPLLRTCIGGLCPSLTFLQLGSWLGAAGHRVAIHDVAVEQEVAGRSIGERAEGASVGPVGRQPGGMSISETIEAIADRIAQANPAVVGLSCKVPADGRYIAELAPRVKARLPDTTNVLGCIWASPSYQAILERVPAVDGVALGEGERGLTALCDRIERGAHPFDDDVPGFAFRTPRGEIKATPRLPAPTAEDHPPLDLSLLPHPEKYTVFPFLTSKGCPYDCTFCAERIIFPDHVETTVARLEADLARLDAFGHDYFLWLSDPLFGANRKRLELIADVLGRSRFHFLMESRVDVLRPESLPLLWESGCDLIYFGLESGSYDTLRRVGKIRSKKGYERYVRQARVLMEACIAADITPVFGVLNPVPGDTEADLQATYDLLSELADIAVATSNRAGTDPGYHFYGFNYRFIRGTRDWDRLDDLAALGATWKQARDDIFRDVVIDAASPTIDHADALAFQQKLAGLVHTTPKGWERLQRSFPPQPLGGLG